MATTSSRTSVDATGLKGPAVPGSWVERVPLLVHPVDRVRWPDPVTPDVRRRNRMPSSTRTRGQLSWFNPRTLVRSRNEILAHIYDPVPAQRQHWMEGVDPTVDLGLADFSFALMGDTGEGDNSQFALLPSLLQQCPDAAFLFICSDVIYPAADVNDYLRKFYRPYADVPFPIYAIPGNHDWYDGLQGFMQHFCDAAPNAAAQRGPLLARLVALLESRPAVAHPERIAHMKAMRADRAQPVRQPGPYYAIETEHVRFVCIDPGIIGSLDRDQAAWLLRASAGPKPKVLLSGKPLVVDGATDPCPLIGEPSGYTTVWDVITEPAHGYVATIGGDVHNYQHYPVTADGRTIHHVVSGGGGAFMHATHQIPPIGGRRPWRLRKARTWARDLGVTEAEFRCYPLRRDSLAAYSRVIHRRVHRGPDVYACTKWCAALEVTPEQANLYLSDVAGVPSNVDRPTVDDPGVTDGRSLPWQVKLVCWLIMGIGGKVFHRSFSPFLDWDDPPFFKNFLRLDVTAERLTITCSSVPGTLEYEHTRVIEDTIEIPLVDPSRDQEGSTTAMA